MPVEKDQFRRILGGFATGVTVVTSVLDGKPGGMTVNSFTSVSLTPPLVLFCADKRTRTHDLVDRSGVYAVNLLSEAMRPLSDLFADSRKTDEERFAAGKHAPGKATGAPIFEGGLGWLECRVVQRVPGGDHTIFVGEVVDMGPGDGPPLMFFRGKYGRMAT